MNHWAHYHRRTARSAAGAVIAAWTIRTALTAGVILGIACGLMSIGALPVVVADGAHGATSLTVYR